MEIWGGILIIPNYSGMPDFPLFDSPYLHPLLLSCLTQSESHSLCFTNTAGEACRGRKSAELHRRADYAEKAIHIDCAGLFSRRRSACATQERAFHGNLSAPRLCQPCCDNAVRPLFLHQEERKDRSPPGAYIGRPAHLRDRAVQSLRLLKEVYAEFSRTHHYNPDQVFPCISENEGSRDQGIQRKDDFYHPSTTWSLDHLATRPIGHLITAVMPGKWDPVPYTE